MCQYRAKNVTIPIPTSQDVPGYPFHILNTSSLHPASHAKNNMASTPIKQAPSTRIATQLLAIGMDLSSRNGMNMSFRYVRIICTREFVMFFFVWECLGTTTGKRAESPGVSKSQRVPVPVDRLIRHFEHLEWQVATNPSRYQVLWISKSPKDIQLRPSG